jgi:formate dehydrogenase (coenzyme F420) alpha subunit
MGEDAVQKPDAAMKGEALVKTSCKMCPEDCGIDVRLRDGMLISVEGTQEHPVNRGRLCPKGQSILDFVCHPNRLKYPLKHVGEKGEDKWQRITWDEALRIIASKLKEVKEEYGAKALAVYSGQAYGHYENKWYLQRFCDAYGTPNFAAAGSMCFTSGAMTDGLTYGSIMIADTDKTKCVIVLGASPTASDPMHASRIVEAKRRGAKLIVVDPRRTPLAKMADIHLQLRPGTDAALGLAMLNTVISERLYDADFVSKWTVGFEELEKRVKDYAPENVEETTWVPADEIRQAARVYADNKPGTIYQGNATSLQTNGFQGYRAFMLLPALTGNVDVEGGNVFPTRLPLNGMRLDRKVDGKPLGSSEYPLFVDYWKEAQALLYADAILTGKPYPVKAMIVAGGNPALLWANSAKVRRALAGLDFLAVIDIFMTDTAKFADIVLPAGSFLERTEFRDYGQTSITSGTPYVMLRNKAVELWECWPDWKIVFELAKTMGYGEYFPWRDIEETIDFILEPSGLTVKQLKERPSGFTYMERKQRRYEENGFKTPSRKIELYSQTLERYGYDPLPAHWETEIELGAPDKYPLILTTGSRILEFTHSQHRNIPKLRKRSPEPWLEIHPSAATRQDIHENEWLIVESAKGRIEIKAKITDMIHPRLLHISHGWSEANVNLLTDDEARDPVTGFPSLKSIRCRIMKKT